VAPLTQVAAEVAAVAARDSYGRLLALLSAATGDLASAEDALADAFERALATWPVQGVPARPDAWLHTVARNRLRDLWKSAATRRTVPLDDRTDLCVDLCTDDPPDVDALPDRRLELLLVCAHPAVDRSVRTPLMLNTVLGFTAAQIGRAYSIPGSTMATRLVRAKRRIREAGVPFHRPDRGDLPARTDAVLEAVYGAYVIDWGTGPQDRVLPSEALHLAEVLAALLPDDAEARGLAALVQLSAARAPARLDAEGRFVPLACQDPDRWDRHRIARAHEHLRAAHALGRVGRFQLEAAIQAVHCARPRTGTADPAILLDLHRALHSVAPSLGSGVALAAVTAQVDGATAGLALLDAVVAGAGDGGRRFQPARVVRAHLLEQLGRPGEAAAAYRSALDVSHDPAERRHLADRLAALQP